MQRFANRGSASAQISGSIMGASSAGSINPRLTRAPANAGLISSACAYKLVRALVLAKLIVNYPSMLQCVEVTRILRDHTFVQLPRFGVAARLLRSKRGTHALTYRDVAGGRRERIDWRTDRAMAVLVAFPAAARTRTVSARRRHR
jgi:hypothetical protein